MQVHRMLCTKRKFKHLKSKNQWFEIVVTLSVLINLVTVDNTVIIMIKITKNDVIKRELLVL